MKENLGLDFGLIIAFLIPGFILWTGLSLTFPELALPLVHVEVQESSVGGFLFVALASLALGLLLSAMRWLLLDHLFVLFGIKAPTMDFSKLKDPNAFAAYIGVVDNHYRYYQYYSNSLIGGLVALAFHVAFGGRSISYFEITAIVLVGVALLLASADSLRKYYGRGGAILKP